MVFIPKGFIPKGYFSEVFFFFFFFLIFFFFFFYLEMLFSEDFYPEGSLLRRFSLSRGVIIPNFGIYRPIGIKIFGIIALRDETFRNNDPSE